MPDICQQLSTKIIRKHSKQLTQYGYFNDKNSPAPTLGNLLFFQQIGNIFSTSDFRHGVIGPASFLLAQCLLQTSLNSINDVCRGLLMCSILNHYYHNDSRFVPEILLFIRNLIRLYGNKHQTKSSRSRAIRSLDDQDNALLWMETILSLDKSKYDKIDPDYVCKVHWKYFQENSDGDDNIEIALSILHVAMQIIRHLSAKFSESTSYAELMAPLHQALVDINLTNAIPFIYSDYSELVSLLSSKIDVCRKERKPLMWRPPQKVIPKSMAPEFEEHFVIRKDMSLSKDQAKIKQLNRQVKREHKAVIRELRRDAEFLNEETQRQRNEYTNKIKTERAKNYSWMEEQQANFNLQVRLGAKHLKGGGSGGAKESARSKRPKRS